MNSSSRPRRSSVPLVRRLVAALALVGLTAGAAAGCLDRPVSPAVPNTSNVFVDQLKQSAVDKIDLLFMIDNSASMADKQEILKDAVPDLVERLVNPVCVNRETGAASLGMEPCPDGSEREFKPIRDIHIGIITSSIGGHGADSCSPDQGATFNPTMNDGGKLIARGLGGMAVDTFGSMGYLAWDPDDKYPGVGSGDPRAVKTQFQSMVQGAGETGCGFEASLEAWYRFLIDPEPYAQIVRVPCYEGDASNGCAAEDGVDAPLLAQRADFLRPDSLVAIVMLSDENDCSVIDDGQFFISVQSSQGAQPFHLPRPTDACFTNPDDPCCRSCGQPPKSGCPDNSSYPSCGTTNGFYDSAGNEDQLNLRCYDQKRRFGIDFLYPIGRYVAGLKNLRVRKSYKDERSKDKLKASDGDYLANPLYVNIQGTDRPPRADSSLVFLAGIVGIPWQLIDGTDIFGDGIDNDGDGDVDEDLAGALRYKTAPDIAKEGLWDQIVGACPNAEVGGDCCQNDGDATVKGEGRCKLGSRETRGLPTEPLMIETPQERTGSGIGGPMMPSSSPANANPINGHEWNVADNDDLQYACIFPLATPRDCAMQGSSCDCTGTKLDTYRKPLCQDPGSGAFGSVQIAAKAYPGLRQLQVLKGFGDNSIVASICARNVSDPNAPDFGYRPAIGAIVDRLKEQLQERCLPRKLAVDEKTGKVPCAIVEATRKPMGGSCPPCSSRAAHTEPDQEVLPAVRKQLEATGACGGSTGTSCKLDICMCEVLPAGGDANGDIVDQGKADACQTQDVPPAGVDGWCYIESGPLVESCPPTAKRKLRFVGEGQGQSGATIFVACIGEAFSGAGAAPVTPAGDGG